MRCAKMRRYRVLKHKDSGICITITKKTHGTKNIETMKSHRHRIRLHGGCLAEDRFESLESLVA